MLPSASGAPVWVDDARVAAGGAPYRADLAQLRFDRIRKRRGDRFGKAHRFDDVDAELGFERSMVLGRQRGRRRAAKADARKPLTRGRRAFEQIRDDRRHDVKPGAAVIDRHVPEAGRREFLRHHQAAAVSKRREHRHCEPVDVIKRQHGGYAIVLLKPMLATDGKRVFSEVCLRQHHALRLAGRAGRVHQQRQRVGCRIDRGSPHPALRASPGSEAPSGSTVDHLDRAARLSAVRLRTRSTQSGAANTTRASACSIT